jgi:hypothetical protein
MTDLPALDYNATAQPANEPLASGLWPPPLAHCGEPLVKVSDEWITVAEVTSEPANGYKGNRLLYTGLISKANVSAVLGSIGGIHNNVSLAGLRVATAHSRFRRRLWLEQLGISRSRTKLAIARLSFAAPNPSVDHFVNNDRGRACQGDA